MTERKPAHLRSEDWVERQIREAQERGVFDHLPGAGKPLPDLDKPWSAERWASDWARREGADLEAALPPALQLRREKERMLADVDSARSEADVRERLEHFNAAVRDAYRRPQLSGPPMTVGLVDVEQAVAGWRVRRAALVAAVPDDGAAGVAPTTPPSPVAVSSWWAPWWGRSSARWRARRRWRGTGSATPRR